MASRLVVFNDFSFLQTDSLSLKSKLYRTLRFRERNYFHSAAYKANRWDGFINFFTIETGKFLTGLLPEVMLALHKSGEEYELDDKRTDILFTHDDIQPDFLQQWQTPGSDLITLEDYQCELTTQALKYRRGVIFAPTSAGKTLVMVAIVKAIKERTPLLILQNRRGLAQQNYDELIAWGIPHVGTCWGGAIKPDIITVATVQSLEKIKKLLPHFRGLLVDEIHDMMSTTPKTVYKQMKGACFRVAMSATPFKFGETDKVQKYMTKGFFGPVLKIDSAKEDGGILTTKGLQKRGRLSKSHCTFFPVRTPNLEYEIYQDAVTRGIAENYDFHHMVKKLAQAQQGRTLILVERIAHGDALNALIPGSIWVRGQDNDTTRKGVVQQLQTHPGNCIAIATHGIFNTGINVFVHTLINAAGGQAEHQIIQRMGRGLRKAKDKASLAYYDFIFYVNEYLLKHSKKRIRILKQQGHEIELKDFDL